MSTPAQREAAQAAWAQRSVDTAKALADREAAAAAERHAVAAPADELVDEPAVATPAKPKRVRKPKAAVTPADPPAKPKRSRKAKAG